METNDKTIETKKPDVEEKNLVSTVQDTKKIIASEENKSETVITSKNNSDSKQTVKNESNDSEDIGFEIITSDLAEKKENVQTKSETARAEVISKPLPEDTNIKEEISKQPEIKTNEHPVDASLIDIKIIKEEDDGSNKDSSESDAQNSEELELALKEIPELSSSTSKEILAKANDEEDKKVVDDIETKAEEKPGGTLIDITVIEETNKDKNVQEVIEEAEHSFEAEVIDDNEDIKVIPSDDEDVIEYTLETRHILPFLTILVAFVAVFAGLIFYYN